MRSAGTSRMVAPAAALILLAACSGGGDDTGGAGDTASTAAATASSPPPPTAAAADDSTPVVATDSTPAPTSAEATTTTTTATGVVPGLAPVELLTVGEGLGIRPLLRWSAVDGTFQYLVVVNTPDGGPYWTWQGPETQVAFGGGPVDDPDTIGARLSSAKTWFVVALDQAGRPIAASESAELGP